LFPCVLVKAYFERSASWCRHKLPYHTAPNLTHHPNWVPLCKMLMDNPTFLGDVHVAAGWYYLYKLFGWVCWSVSSFVSVYGLWLWSVAAIIGSWFLKISSCRNVKEGTFRVPNLLSFLQFSWNTERNSFVLPIVEQHLNHQQNCSKSTVYKEKPPCGCCCVILGSCVCILH
jgi:hypothetical protein